MVSMVSDKINGLSDNGHLFARSLSKCLRPAYFARVALHPAKEVKIEDTLDIIWNQLEILVTPKKRIA